METNPLAKLIIERLKVLELTKHEFVRRLGYRNIGKGLNRLQQICAGNFTGADYVLKNLANILQLDPSLVESSLAETERNALLSLRRQYEYQFKPHAVFLTEHRIPQQIVMAALIGADQKRYVYFDFLTDPRIFKSRVLKQIPATIPLFGAVNGFVINFSPRYAIRYDLKGDVVEVLEKARTLGEIRIS